MNKNDVLFAAGNGIILTVINLFVATLGTGLGYTTYLLVFLIVPLLFFAIESYAMKNKNIQRYILSYVVFVVLFLAFTTITSVTYSTG